AAVELDRRALGEGAGRGGRARQARGGAGPHRGEDARRRGRGARLRRPRGGRRPGVRAVARRDGEQERGEREGGRPADHRPQVSHKAGARPTAEQARARRGAWARAQPPAIRQRRNTWSRDTSTRTGLVAIHTAARPTADDSAWSVLTTAETQSSGW